MKRINAIFSACLCLLYLNACHAPGSSERENAAAHTPGHTGHSPFLEQGIRAYVRQDYDKAITVFTQASAAGQIKAPRYIGLMYLNGYGVEKNARRAAAEFSKAAFRGDPAAQFWLGYCYEQGMGVTADAQEALKWYRLSAQHGDERSAPAMVALGRLAESENNPEAIQWYRQSAALGSLEAQAALLRLNADS